MKRLLAALLAALWLLLPAAAHADERILSFISDVEVSRDGTLAVTEAITVRSEGISIRHGIFRDFPTRYRDRMGRQVRVGFEVVDVTLDGGPVPWTRSAQGNGVRVRIGDPEAYVPVGEHVYRIRYTTTRQLGFFDDFDELYWNVTGNGWDFAIDKAEARIRLPEAVPLGQRAVYTGPQGSTAGDARVVSEQPGEIVFRTTMPLGPREGLTVAVAWPKGVVEPPSQDQQLGWWVEGNGPPAVGVLGLLGVLGYYVHAWRRAGRDPRPGTIVPLFTPPDELTPAGMRYIREMGSDSRTFAAALVDLGVRGKLRLVEGERPMLFGLVGRPPTTIEKTGDPGDLPPAEAAMMRRLFLGDDSVLMINKNHATFRAAQEALTNSLKKQFEGRMFLRNWGWSLRGLAVTFLAIWLTAAAVVLTDSSGGPATGSLLLPLGSLGVMALAAWLYLSASRSGASSALGKVLGVILGMIGLALAASTIGAALNAGRLFPLLIPLLALPVVISAFWWMAAPTLLGRQVLDRIAGFGQYLSIAEEDRLARLHPPEKTPELFERYLPYAIALEVENEWADRFASVLAAAAAAGQTQTMGWYSGRSDPWTNPGRFAERIGSSLSSTISSASSAPGSSSGSGGGGSSGGGGGGGGGGGW